jgi:type III pantothenate kinase
MSKTNEFDWLGLAIGNSRWHWAHFQGKTLVKTWESAHLSADLSKTALPCSWPNLLIYVASVVPQQTALLKNWTAQKLKAIASQNTTNVDPPSLWEVGGNWEKSYPQSNRAKVLEITLSQIPLPNIYPTMGIDRALAVWGAAQTYGLPILTIDAGTALTFTGATCSPHHSTLIGGAILPGLRLQFQMLGRKTAALPEVQLPDSLPLRWSLDTPGAIASGVLYTVLAGIRDFIRDWWERFPDSRIVLTGGDAAWLRDGLQQQCPDLAARIVMDEHLIFWGMRSLLFEKTPS